jgi:adenylosuccinate synthase
VRVAGPNAGHTGYDADGRAWALRQVPVAAVTDGPAVLGVAPGSEIDLPVLLDEFDSLRDAGLFRNKMLWVSGEATMIYDHHKWAESDLVSRIGSTGKGIGEARSARIHRSAKRLADDEDALAEFAKRGIPVAPSRHSIAQTMDPNGHLIIEGTQGYGLGLRAGHYPQCTSSDCRAIDFMAMAGVHAWEFTDTTVWAVARMFPIRVAGNSGPLKNEVSWEELNLPEERTTVTKKVRRVGMPDWDLVRDAVTANGGAPVVRLAITMVDQMFPFMKDRTFYDVWEGSDAEQNAAAVSAYLSEVQRQTGANIGMITTGPNKASFL